MEMKMTQADLRGLEIRAKRGDPEAAILLGMFRKGQVGGGVGGPGGAGVPFLIDGNKPEAVPPEHQAPVKCGKCGNGVFEVQMLLRLVRDAREAERPTRVGSGKAQYFECVGCKSIWFWAAREATTPASAIIGAEPKPEEKPWIEWTLLSEGASVRGLASQVVNDTLHVVGKVLDTAMGDSDGGKKRSDEIMGLILTNLGFEKEEPTPTTPTTPPAPSA